MHSKPLKQHQWLQQFVGNWKFIQDCSPELNPEGTQSEGTVAAASLGELWLLLDYRWTSGSAATEELTTWNSRFQLGYDPTADRFVGSFIGSMMYQQWIYNGQLDEAAQVLTLDTEGPAFDGNGTSKYRDMFELVDKDHWNLRSQVQTPNGEWVQFMVSKNERIAAA